MKYVLKYKLDTLKLKTHNSSLDTQIMGGMKIGKKIIGISSDRVLKKKTK